MRAEVGKTREMKMETVSAKTKGEKGEAIVEDCNKEERRKRL